MGEVAISLKNVSKCFKRYARPVDRLKEILLPRKQLADEFWALKDVNLQVLKGETLGIIGQNGAGKSTLLQVIAGTLTPSAGEVKVNGRVSALLELGSGFNPEFTGRQNVFFNGRILGLSQRQIEHKVEEIAEFADIGDFIDQPVKTYSSGMFVRLAFAVAVSTEPDILIVDEALAVGDVFFQQKCFERIRKLRDGGTTLLFVSHDSGSVYSLCKQAVLFEAGRLVLRADAKQVIDLYEVKLLKQNDRELETVAIQAPSETGSPQTNFSSSGSDVVAVVSPELKVYSVQLLDEDNQKTEFVISGRSLQIVIGVEFLEAFDDPVVGFMIRDRTGFTVFVNHTYGLDQPIGSVNQGTTIETCFRVNVPLAEGDYTITIGVSDGGREGYFERNIARVHNAASFKVLRDKETRGWGGIVNLYPTVETHRKAHV
ncbi:ABC transporter ATP-binding protein [Phormidesmis sp. 146-12]